LAEASTYFPNKDFSQNHLHRISISSNFLAALSEGGQIEDSMGSASEPLPSSKRKTLLVLDENELFSIERRIRLYKCLYQSFGDSS